MRTVKDVNIENFLATLHRYFNSKFPRGVKDFCQDNPQFEPADVSRFFKGEKNWGYKKLFLFLSLLKVQTSSIDFFSMCFLDTFIQMNKSDRYADW